MHSDGTGVLMICRLSLRAAQKWTPSSYTFLQVPPVPTAHPDGAWPQRQGFRKLCPWLRGAGRVFHCFVSPFHPPKGNTSTTGCSKVDSSSHPHVQLELDLACSSSCSGAGQGGVVTGYFAVNGTCEESWKGNGDEDKNGHCLNKYWEINKSRGVFVCLFVFWPNAAWKKHATEKENFPSCYLIQLLN